MTDPVGRSSRPRWLAILRLRCPYCREGRVFHGLLRMHAACPQCGLTFEREPGYFYGSYYFSYALLVLVALPVAGVLMALGVTPETSTWAACGAALVAAPFLTRWARVGWMHFDDTFDPRAPGDRGKT